MTAVRAVGEPVDVRRSARRVPPATVSRLPLYLRALAAFAADGVSTTSSSTLAAAAGVGSAQLRKDLSFLGSHGTRGVGYDVANLSRHLTVALGLTSQRHVVIVGVGHLGHALANYSGLAGRNFSVVGLVDADPRVVGTTVAGLEVQPADRLGRVVAASGATIAVIATPAEVAQDVCDAAVAAGVTGVLNFAPCSLRVPPEVDLRVVDLGSELQILAFHDSRKADAGA
ncbi:redox-sensing transcriptional repressor Rex [Pengzhenrongella sicca]|uniref:Redox-sensing transcriptional repressor Rex n=1 Tax=Pengzhenrongella sicca TaxID=2819238 RepID=A0A8A4ZCL2_9MICO|nr:redox-sensing transcriptional repressor Rex [Pengzhenrongella sicca]QTE29151.1 redox-sensing transcriptional repressor Rex [Pengzhenrongella sicca]